MKEINLLRKRKSLIGKSTAVRAKPKAVRTFWPKVKSVGKNLCHPTHLRILPLLRSMVLPMRSTTFLAEMDNP